MEESNFIEVMNSIGVKDIQGENDDTWVIHTEPEKLYYLAKFFRQKPGSRILDITYGKFDSILYYVFLVPGLENRKTVKVVIPVNRIMFRSINSVYPSSEILERKAEFASDLRFKKVAHSYVVTNDIEEKDGSNFFAFWLIANEGIVEDARVYLGSVYYKIEARIRRYGWAEIPHRLGSMITLCPFSHQLAYTKALEKIAPLREPSEGMTLFRVFFLELERIARHLLWIGMIADFVGIPEFLKKAFNVRNELSLKVSDLNRLGLSKSRSLFSPSMFDLPKKMRIKLTQYMEELETKIHELFEDPSYQQVIQLVEEIGKLEREKIDSFDPVGPIARALGQKMDMRQILEHEGYDKLPIRIAVSNENDVAGLVKVRAKETENSVLLLQALLEIIPSQFPGNFEIPSNYESEEPGSLERSRQSLGIVEAPGGLLTYHLITDPNGRISMANIVTPSMRNFPVLLERMKGEEISHAALFLRTIEMSDLVKTVFIYDSSREKTVSYSMNELTEQGKKIFERRRKK